MGEDRIAVTVWGGRVSPVLDVSSRALLLTVQDGQAGERTELDLPEAGDAKLAALSSRGVQTLLCGAVSRPVAELAAAFGLRLVPFLAGDVELVIAAYLSGQLPSPSLSMPGCHGRRHGRAGRRCRRGQPVEEREETMPRGDGTGPRGEGPGTGRGQGPCQGEPRPGGTRPGGGRGTPPRDGRGAGQGQGRGKGKGPRGGAGPQR